MDNLAPKLANAVPQEYPEGLKTTIAWILKDARQNPGAYLFETLVPGGGE